MMVTSPCMDCPDRGMRQVGDKQFDCHSVCQKYLDFKLEIAKMREEEWKENMLDQYLSERKWKR